MDIAPNNDKQPLPRGLPDYFRVLRGPVNQMSRDYYVTEEVDVLFGLAFKRQIDIGDELFNRVAGFIASPDLKYPIVQSNFEDVVRFVTEKYAEDDKKMPPTPPTVAIVYRISEDPDDPRYMLFTLDILDGVDNNFKPETESFLPNPNYYKTTS